MRRGSEWEGWKRMKLEKMKLEKMKLEVTDYRAGFTHGLIVGVTGGVTTLGTVLFLFKYWL